MELSKRNELLLKLDEIDLVAADGQLEGIQSKDDQDYRIYHQQIIEVEKLICDEEFGEAFSLLEKVFNDYDFVFARDYKIAAQLALYLEKKGIALQYIKAGMAAGWQLKALEKNKYLAQLRNEADWNIIEQEYPDLQKEYSASIDQSTRENVREMFKKDQGKALGALFRIGDKAQEKYAMKKFAPHSEIQMTNLIKILENQGYPGERLIGNDYWMSTIISHHNSISRSYAQMDTLYSFIKPMLYQAIKEGQISPYECAMIDDWYIAVSTNRTESGYGFLNPPEQTTLSETNLLRHRIGLRSIALRNNLVEVENNIGMNFYLPDWVEGIIEVE